MKPASLCTTYCCEFADWSYGMLAIIRCRIFCFTDFQNKLKNKNHTNEVFAAGLYVSEISL